MPGVAPVEGLLIAVSRVYSTRCVEPHSLDCFPRLLPFPRRERKSGGGLPVVGYPVAKDQHQPESSRAIATLAFDDALSAFEVAESAFV